MRKGAGEDEGMGDEKGKGGDENTVIASILLIPRGQQSRKEEEGPRVAWPVGACWWW